MLSPNFKLKGMSYILSVIYPFPFLYVLFSKAQRKYNNTFFFQLHLNFLPVTTPIEIITTKKQSRKEPLSVFIKHENGFNVYPL